MHGHCSLHGVLHFLQHGGPPVSQMLATHRRITSTCAPSEATLYQRRSRRSSSYYAKISIACDASQRFCSGPPPPVTAPGVSYARSAYAIWKVQSVLRKNRSSSFYCMPKRRLFDRWHFTKRRIMKLAWMARPSTMVGERTSPALSLQDQRAGDLGVARRPAGTTRWLSVCASVLGGVENCVSPGEVLQRPAPIVVRRLEPTRRYNRMGIRK